jgi:hypothetical protein
MKEANLKQESAARSELIVQQNEQINQFLQNIEELQIKQNVDNEKISTLTTV